jgi:hypothetical protein
LLYSQEERKREGKRKERKTMRRVPRRSVAFTITI